MTIVQKYLGVLSEYLQSLEDESDPINAAAEILAGAVREDRLIHVFGTDPYSASSSDEFFFKAGGLVNVSPIYDPTFSFAHGASRAGMCQALNGLSPAILDYYEYIEQGDPIVVIGSDPQNIVFLQALARAREKGLKLIAIAPFDRGEGGRLDADAAISTRAPEVDTLLSASGVLTGGVATALASAVINMIVAATLEKIENPTVWSGKRLADCDANEALIAKYIHRVKHL